VSIPLVISIGVRQGESGVTVSLRQTCLIFTTHGSARNALAGASATSYFGSITTKALKAYQANSAVD
jgi:hypothetical protein